MPRREPLLHTDLRQLEKAISLAFKLSHLMAHSLPFCAQPLITLYLASDRPGHADLVKLLYFSKAFVKEEQAGFPHRLSRSTQIPTPRETFP